jgi:phosphoribosylglycinamide formyltransferase-1
VEKLIGVLISGRGSNLQALIEADRDGRLGGHVRVVIANRAEAPGLVRAQAAGIEALVMPHGDYLSREAFDAALAAALTARGVRLVCLAGFMRLIGRTFCDAFPHAILNIHPALLPAFPGKDAVGQALRHGARVSGATVHFVTPELDAGPIVMQHAVPVKDDDTADSLAARILAVEHRLYPEAVRRVLEDDWRIDGRRVVFGTPSEKRNPAISG